MTQPAPQNMNVQVIIQPVQVGPTEHKLMLTLASPGLQTSLGPLSGTELQAFLSILNGRAPQAIEEIKRANLGLIIPGNGHGGAPGEVSMPLPRPGQMPHLP